MAGPPQHGGKAHRAPQLLPPQTTPDSTSSQTQASPSNSDVQAQMTEAEADKKLAEIRSQAESSGGPVIQVAEGEEKEGGEQEEEQALEVEGQGAGEALAGPPPAEPGGGMTPPPPVPSGSPVPSGDVADSLLGKYRDEKAWHDNWTREGQPVGMAHDDRWALIGQSIGSGGVEGLTGAASAMIVDTLLNKATKRIPYAAGFISIGEMFTKGPTVWADEQWANTFGKAAGGVDKLFNGDWIDKLEGVIDIVDGLNTVVSLLSTVCMIVAAAGFIASIFFPVLIPFVALAAKWGLLLGEISTLVGLGVTALRAVAILARTIQIASSDADPETQLERAHKLKESTAAWTGEYASRRANQMRTNRQQERTSQRESSDTPTTTTPPATHAPAGAAPAQNTVNTTTQRRSTTTSRVLSVVSGLSGGNASNQLNTVHTATSQTREMTAGVRDNTGEDRLNAVIEADPAAVSAASERRAREHHEAEANRQATAAAQARRQRTEAEVLTARSQATTADEAAAVAQTRAAESQRIADAERARVGEPDVPQALQRQRRIVDNMETNLVRHDDTVAMYERAATSARLYEEAMIRGAAENPDLNLAIQVIEAKQTRNRRDYHLEMARINRRSAESHLDIQTRRLDAEMGVFRARTRLPEENTATADARASQTATDAAGTATTNAVQARTDNRVAGQQMGAAGVAQNTSDAQVTVGAQSRAMLADAQEASTDTRRSFPTRYNLDGSQVPANAYGHQGTGGVTGQATGLVMNADVVKIATAAASTAANDALGLSLPGKKDPAAIEAFSDASQASMSEDHRSMTSDLPAAPVQQETSMDEAAVRYAEIESELARLAFQRETVGELRTDAAADVDALSQMNTMMTSNKAGAQAHQTELDAKKTKQDEVRTKVSEQATESGGVEQQMGGGMGKVVGFVGKFVEMCGMVPSKVYSGAGAAAGRAQEVQKGVESTTEGGAEGKAKADEANAGLDEMGAQTATAKGLTTEADGAMATLESQFSTDLAEAQGGSADIDAAGVETDNRAAQLQAAKTEQQSLWQQAVSGMTGWAVNHESLRTTGETRTTTTLGGIESQLPKYENGQ
jgi:hypothetical protein